MNKIHGLFDGVTFDDRDVMCNAYCKDGVHCDLVYSIRETPKVPLELIRKSCESVYVYSDIEVVGFEKAAEAPPPQNGMFDVSWGWGDPTEQAYLLFWKLKSSD